MRALLDTHVLVWWAADDARLSARAREVLRDPANELLFSAASAWELVMKAQTGRVVLPESPAAYIPGRLSWYAIDALPVELHHVLGLVDLPLRHRDPFDRLLVAQSRVENLPIVTNDPLIAQYQVETIW